MHQGHESSPAHNPSTTLDLFGPAVSTAKREDSPMINCRAVVVAVCVVCSGVGAVTASIRAAEDVLPGTTKLELSEPLDEVMVRGIGEFAETEIELAQERRKALWNRDYSSPEAYEKSISANRERLRIDLGAIDHRFQETQVLVDIAGLATPGAPLTQIRQDVLQGVSLTSVVNHAGKSIIFIPDAGYDPEMSAGVLPGLPATERLSQRLKAQYEIGTVMPVIMTRSEEFSGNPNVRMTNQPHREFIYRGAFEMGRHVIGYEIVKIHSLVDAMIASRKIHPERKNDPVIVWGHGEGGLLAMHAAALDPRIDVCIVSGYFQTRDRVWEEPIYRNVWRQLTEFGDSDVASLIAPRRLIIEACSTPEVDGPPAPRPGRGAGAAPGKIRTPTIDLVEREFARAKAHYDQLNAGDKITLVKSGDGTGPIGAGGTLDALRKALGTTIVRTAAVVEPAEDEAQRAKITARQKFHFEEMRLYTQRIMHVSDKYRDKVWAKADRSSMAKWQETQEAYRDLVYEEVIGRIPYDLLPPNVRTRKIIDEPTHTGYEVVLDVWEKGGAAASPSGHSTVFAGGVLLLPKNLKDGEKRPAVVCQHGLEGVPNDTISIDPQHPGFPYYKGFSTELVKRGFIVYAPQNPYRGQDRFRVLQRKSNPMGRSLYSYIIPQHQQTINWLASLPYVDRERIAFYGLSYGGKTAVRVPPMLSGRNGNAAYCLSICSADYDEWVLKIVTTEDRYSYMFTGEYEIMEWNMGHVANYAELATLMTPRPFMVERGHDDGVAPDEWVAWEFFKVKRHYDKLGIGDRAELEVFDGPHTINGVGTYNFLHRHLNWPQPTVAP